MLGVLYSLCLMKKIRKRKGEIFFESLAFSSSFFSSLESFFFFFLFDG